MQQTPQRSEDQRWEVIILTSSLCYCLETLGIIVGNIFACHLSEKASRHSDVREQCAGLLCLAFLGQDVLEQDSGALQ